MLQEYVGDNVSSLVIQLEEGGLVAYLEGVDGVFEEVMDYSFVVVEGDNGRSFFGSWVVVLIFGDLVLSDG